MDATELKNIAKETACLPVSGCSRSMAAWHKHANNLRSLILERNPHDFLQWKVIRDTMVAPGVHTGKRMDYLTSHPDYNKLRPLLTDHAAIQMIYHVMQYQDRTGLHVSELSSIVEFGGGYGNLCRAIHRLGFNGQYTIWDLPIFSALQRFYLENSGITRVACGQICQPVETDLFIATWSLSEVSHGYKDYVLRRVRAGSVLIAYSNVFEEIGDNRAYFKRWAKPHWHHWEMPFLRGHYYLIGNDNLSDDL